MNKSLSFPLRSNTNLPLHELLWHTGKAIAAVKAGRSLTQVLAQCPAKARPGTQALTYHALRYLGATERLRQLLIQRSPPAWVDGLLLTALSLLLARLHASSTQTQADDTTLPLYEPHTIVNQAVECAKRHTLPQSKLVNASLRRFLREATALLAQLELDPVAQWNHPLWWIEKLQQDWPHTWQDHLRKNNQRPPMTLRIHVQRTTAQAYLTALQNCGIQARAMGPYTVVLDSPYPVEMLPGFAAGDVSVQDAAAQIAAPLLLGLHDPTRSFQLAAGARVLDACAAPGGKTAHLLELANLNVLALDIDAQRLQKVTDNLTRLGLTAQTQAAHAGQPETWWDGQLFDAILLDAPCSASGIVRRHPDVRWLRQPHDLAALACIQDQLLDALWPLLAPGGRLLYCTCSIFLIEGQQRSDAFLQRTPDAELHLSTGYVGCVADNRDLAAPAATLISQPATRKEQDRFDGFYYALFEKRSV